MMKIEDKNHKNRMYKGMQQPVKAKVLNSFHKKLAAQDASGESSDMNESEHLDKLFDFLLKTSSNPCRVVL